MMFRAVFWVVLPCKMIVMMMEAVRTSETSVDNHFTRQYNPEDSSEHHWIFRTALKRPNSGDSVEVRVINFQSISCTRPCEGVPLSLSEFISCSTCHV
jgi:hypothetical protein